MKANEKNVFRHRPPLGRSLWTKMLEVINTSDRT